MRWADQLSSVRHTFATNRARAALTLLGVVIGAGSIVLLAGLLRGGEEALLNSEQAASEADILRISSEEAPVKMRKKTRRELVLDDQVQLGESRLLAETPAAAFMFRQGRARWKDRTKDVTLNGLTPEALPLYRLQVASGRFLSDDDLRLRRRVCVVGQDVWDDLLARAPSLDGVEIEVADHLWQVVGVLKNKPLLGGNLGTWMWNRRVLVPNTTFDSLYAANHHVGTIFVRVGAGGGGDQLGAFKSIVEGTLLRRHLGVRNFQVDGGQGEKTSRNLIFGVIEVLLLGTGLLSLFVGGINIMNIMLVTVTERTREIGVRRAVGASPGAILMQFLLESAFIATTGGAIGVAGGIGLSWLLSILLTRLVGQWTLHIEPWSVALGLGLSLLTGVVFGLFPAWRAARLDPVEALRYE